MSKETKRQLERNEGYFRVICAALEIKEDSDLTGILIAIDKLSNKALISKLGWVTPKEIEIILAYRRRQQLKDEAKENEQRD